MEVTRLFPEEFEAAYNEMRVAFVSVVLMEIFRNTADPRHSELSVYLEEAEARSAGEGDAESFEAALAELGSRRTYDELDRIFMERVERYTNRNPALRDAVLLARSGPTSSRATGRPSRWRRARRSGASRCRCRARGWAVPRPGRATAGSSTRSRRSTASRSALSSRGGARSTSTSCGPRCRTGRRRSARTGSTRSCSTRPAA
jgi:hypothetical protein